jgi:peptide/nickel transport system permease protein
VKELKYGKLNKRLIAGGLLLGLILVPVVINVFHTAYDPNEVNYAEKFLKPSWAHFFGTDDFGRDIFTRVMMGAATTFGIALFTVTFGALIGTVIGALTGYFGGIVDEILMRINDCLVSFPSILLSLVVFSLLDKGTWNICIALGIVFVPSFARIIRAEFLKERGKDYVLNARLMGAGHLRIVFKHVFPNTLPILFSAVLVGINNAVLAEAGLSYLGLGVQPPEPSLGRMLSEAKTYLFKAPWYELFPCLVMIVFILGLTMVSENFGVSGVSLNAVKRKIDRIREKSGVPEEEDTKDKDDLSEKKDTPIISVKDLDVGFIEDDGIDDTLKGVSFDLYKGEVLGVVGESGSGKSLTAMSIMGILSDKTVITGGSILLDGKTDLTKLDEDEYRKLRGGRLAYIFQEPMTSLNPVKTIGAQIDEILDIHASHLPEAEQKKLVIDSLEDVGLPEPDKLYNMYPHQLSGGMRQRVCIAMALVAKADVILADEPTTALDANVADVILDIFKHINRKYKAAIILISHDLRVIGKLADRVIIMQDGNIVETLGVDISRKKTEGKDGKYSEMPDHSFEIPRTQYGRHLFAAAFSDKIYKDTEDVDKKQSETIVSAENLSVFYKSANKREKELKKVIDNVTFSIPAGKTTGFVGESGCGKSTLVKAIAGLQKYTEGSIVLKGDRPGMVFQDPYSSLNPAFKVRRILEEPLRLKNGFGRSIIKKNREKMLSEIKSMLHKVELGDDILERKVSELSGGQRQRIAIALALLQKKALIILDEPVSALDVTIQEQILELLMKLKKSIGLTYILISHDKRLVSRACDEVYMVENGHVTPMNS